MERTSKFRPSISKSPQAKRLNEWIVWTEGDGEKFSGTYMQCRKYVQEFFCVLVLYRAEPDGEGGWMQRTKAGIVYYYMRRGDAIHRGLLQPIK